MNKQLGTISLLTSDRQASSQAMNKIISDYGHHIMARLGVHIDRHCADHCTGLITLAVEATEEDIKTLVAELNEIPEIKAQYLILTNE